MTLSVLPLKTGESQNGSVQFDSNHLSGGAGVIEMMQHSVVAQDVAQRAAAVGSWLASLHLSDSLT